MALQNGLQSQNNVLGGLPPPPPPQMQETVKKAMKGGKGKKAADEDSGGNLDDDINMIIEASPKWKPKKLRDWFADIIADFDGVGGDGE